MTDLRKTNKTRISGWLTAGFVALSVLMASKLDAPDLQKQQKEALPEQAASTVQHALDGYSPALPER